MALSNIRNEPRREITESLAGIGFLLALIGMDWFGSKLFVYWFIAPSNRLGWPDQLMGMMLIPLFLGLIFVIVVGVLYVTHAMGEGVCGWLANRGLEIRPKQRYGRRY